MAQTLTIRERMLATSGRIRSLKRADTMVRVVITLGGLSVVASVLGILVVIAAEAWPLFVPPRGERLGPVSLGPVPAPTPPLRQVEAAAAAGPVAVPTPVPPASPALLALGVDEYQKYVYVVRSNARVEVYRLTDGTWARGFDLPGISGGTVSAASRSLTGHQLAAATRRAGRVALARMTFRPLYEGARLSDLEVGLEERGTVELDPAGRTLTLVDYVEDDAGASRVAALAGDDEILLWARDALGEERRSTLRTGGERVTALALGDDELVAGTDTGRVHHWELRSDTPRLANVSPVGAAPITALEWAVGEVTFLAGNAFGEVSAWFQGRLREDDEHAAMLRAHAFPAQGAPIRAIAAATRDKSFVTVGEDGSLVLRYLTNERTLLRLDGAKGATSVLVTPKNDGILVGLADGSLVRYALAVPHPETTWRSLFGKVWYEGYARAEYVWQSTGATNDFEAKFSLVPLVFGTLKATFYALVFAIPLAVLGALYTSQFVHPSIRARVKPTVEIMAALPSVVIGFVAGLYLAPLVERVLVPVLLMFVLLPALGTAGVLLWARLPVAVARRLKPGMELGLIIPLLLLAAWLALQLGPPLEAALFDRDLKLWLSTTLGMTYDQRNSLVVGLAMGFAVIPIIFTIADDAFSAVPSSLTAGSLALGASRWQTALRVILPTASPGVFSAVMIGFGRAVGETMIVLMATGNTPVLDWSIFNGMRTLSANIAVEIPEAPHGDSLYRVLFLAAALLFAMTFVANTAAEVVRQRLRERYRAL